MTLADLRRGAAVAVPRDVVLVAGPDALAFLQGQLSQDVEALEVGGSAFSLLLQPQGRVETFLRVTRVGDEELVLDTDEGFGEAMTARLERFKLRIRADLSPLPWRCLAVRGDAVPDPGPRGGDDGASWAVVPETPGAPGYDLLGPDPQPPDGVPVADPAIYDALRIRSGVPRMGAELDERTIPAEAGIVDRTVSFTKGCYTGQELVARIDSRGGNVPRRLRGLVVAGDRAPAPGAAVVVGGDEVGKVTSAAVDDRGVVALAYVRRAVEPPADAVLRWDEGDASSEIGARVEALPLPGD